MEKHFMCKDFLLQGETAKLLYHEHAAKVPIIDYHCHIDPRQIYENHIFENLSEAWLAGDHYKWRAMRSNGVPERFVTGKDTSPYEKFEKWAQTLPKLIGNPLYHWTHLELQRYFGIEEPLSPETCKSIWDQANQLLKEMPVREIIKRSGVETICTTDDPIDDLRWHKLLNQVEDLPCKVLPAFRPDKAINIEKPGYLSYLAQLEAASGVNIDSVDALKDALAKRLAFFREMGCRAADHGLDYLMFEDGVDTQAVFEKAKKGEPVSMKEADAFKTDILCFLSQQYKEMGMVMQLHYGAVRNTNPPAFKALGPDSGYDAIWGAPNSGRNLAGLLGKMEAQGGLPKTIVYSLNPTDNAQIGAIIGCFQNDEVPGKIQHGSAWWFNDTKQGMIDQIVNLANFSVLGNFVGMLTDSRSFLSYTRHEYFRRILCNLLGQWVDNGEYPRNLEALGKTAEDISYNNAKNYFQF